MKQVLFSLTLLTAILFTAAIVGFAQSANSKVQQTRPKPNVDISAEKSSMDDPAPLTTFEEEMRAKRNIRLAEKEHEENLKRAREVSQLARDLQTLATTKPTLSKEDQKKVERLEKLTKQIRGEAGGEDEEMTIQDKPTDLPSALKQVSAAAETFSKDVQNTPRQVVSASVIGRANVLLELIKVLKGFTRLTGN